MLCVCMFVSPFIKRAQLFVSEMFCTACSPPKWESGHNPQPSAIPTIHSQPNPSTPAPPPPPPTPCSLLLSVFD